MSRNYLIDVFKFFGAFAVVVIHVTAVIKNKNLDTFWNYQWYRPLLNFAVPFFFSASGYFLFQNIIKKSDGVKYLWNYAMKILKYYIVFSLFYIGFGISVRFFDQLFLGESFRTSVSKMVGGWNYTKVFNGTIGQYHLWFLTSLFVAVLILMILYRLNLKAKSILLISVMIYSLSLVKFVKIDELYIYGGLTKGLFYLSIGYFVASINPNKVVLPGIGLFLSTLSYYAFTLKNVSITEIPLALMAFYMVAICSKYPSVGKDSVFAKLGAQSLGIYVLHLFARDIVIKIYVYSGIPNFYDSLFYYLIATLVSIIVPLLIFKFMTPLLNKCRLVTPHSDETMTLSQSKKSPSV